MWYATMETVDVTSTCVMLKNISVSSCLQQIVYASASSESTQILFNVRGSHTRLNWSYMLTSIVTQTNYMYKQKVKQLSGSLHCLTVDVDGWIWSYYLSGGSRGVRGCKPPPHPTPPHPQIFFFLLVSLKIPTDLDTTRILWLILTIHL